MEGSILRGADSSIADARAKISEIKLIIRDMIDIAETNNIDKGIINNLQEALSILMDLDDRK